MAGRDPDPKDPEEELLLQQSRRLVEELDALIRRAKVLTLEHRVVVAKLKEKQVKSGSQ